VALEKSVFDQISLPSAPVANVLNRNLYMHEYSHLFLILTMKMEAARKSETSETLHTYARYEDPRAELASNVKHGKNQIF
jgi:ABC-type uncharacterized transport system ATPase subunit